MLSLLAFSCEKEETPAKESRLTICTADGRLTVSGAQIRSYNRSTRELVWNGDQAFRPEELKDREELVFELDGEELFRACAVSPVMSYLEYGLVLCSSGGKFTLGYGYPSWVADTEESLREAEKDAAGWTRFIECLKSERRLK